MKILKVSCCKDCPGRQYEWCTISRNKHDCKKIRNINIFPAFCLLLKYKQTKFRIWKVTCCENCRHQRTNCRYSNLYNYSSWCFIELGKNGNEKKITNRKEIPKWYPLEDYKE